MKSRLRRKEVKRENVLTLSFDVGKAKLNLYAELETGEGVSFFEEEFRNRTEEILKKLREYRGIAKTHGLSVRVLCEPTGGYEFKLLSSAHKLGLRTSYVNGEAVSKLSMVESNDTGKTDVKDPRVIDMVDKYGKNLKHRILPSEYQELRKLNWEYDVTTNDIVRTRCMFHDAVMSLFVDLSWSSYSFYNKTGRILIEKYHLNPYKIISSGYSRFARRIRGCVPGVKERTLKRIREDAGSSVLHEMSESYIAVLDNSLMHLWKKYLFHERRKEYLKLELVKVYRRLPEKHPDVVRANHELGSEVMFARILGETGPLGDFKSESQLLRYAGLNLREKSSGTIKGQIRISKKGRSSLRKVLHMAVLSLVKTNGLLGDVYRQMKARMGSNKAMTAMMRKYLKALYGLSKSKTGFVLQRFFVCESMYKKHLTNVA